MQLTKDTASNLLSGTQPRLVNKPATMHPGDVISERFAILSLIGSGSTGDVYKAKQYGVDRSVAVKTLRGACLGDQDVRARFLREAKVLSTLDHPNISKIYSLGVTENGQPYFVIDYVSGQPLSDYIDGSMPLSQSQFIDIIGQVIRALQHAHSRGIVHRDLKPANILLERQGEHFNVKIVDFGIASAVGVEYDQSLTRDGCVVGSPAYMSPEQCLGHPPDARSDIYSLGCVMYELLTGRPPFQHEEPSALLRAHVIEQPDPIHKQKTRVMVSADLLRVVQAAMQKDPQCRYQSAEALLIDLERVHRGQHINGSGVRTKPNAKPTVRPAAALLSILSGVLIACMILGLFWHTTQRDLEREHALRRADILVAKALDKVLYHSFHDAEVALAQAFDIYSKAGCDGHKLVGVCFDRGRIDEHFRNLDQAIAQYQLALSYRNSCGSSPHSKAEIAEVEQHLAAVLRMAKRPLEAVPLMEDVEKYYLSKPDKDTDGTKEHIVNLQRLAAAYMLAGRYADAEPIYERLLQAERTYGAPCDVLAGEARQYATVLEHMGKQEQSRQALAMAQDYDRRARLE